MKKMLLLLAGMACLGMFVSCSDDPQEIVVDYANKQYEYRYYGTVTGSGTVAGSVTSVTFDSLPKSYIRYYNNVDTDKDGVLTISETNVKYYYLRVSVKATGSSSGYDTAYINIAKIGDEYWCEDEKITVTGSPKSAEFTLTGTIDAVSYKFTNLKFTRK